MTKNIMLPSATGFIDKHGRNICVGDIVLDKNEFTGIVVFAYGAFRYDIRDGHFLKFNSSLLWDEVTGTEELIVIRKGN